MQSKDPVGDAIAALTEAARGTRTIGAGTPHEHRERVDFGEIACHVLTAVAANVGGVERLLSGRPGSWEADYVRQIVLSTAGDSAEDLQRWRTQFGALASDLGTERRSTPGVVEDHVGRTRAESSRSTVRDVEGGSGEIVGPPR